MRDFALLIARGVVGGYVAAHGAQKLFGTFGGRGLEGTGAGFARMGLEPGPPMAALAGVNELGGGALTALGLGGPIGPIAVAATMATAAGTAHRGKGAFAQSGGPELPIANIATAVALAGTGFGRYSLDHLLSLRVPRVAIATMLAGATAMSAYLVARSVRAQQRAAGAPEPERAPTREPALTNA